MSRRLPAVLVFLVTAAVFAPTLGYQFQKAWDDGGMLLFNNHLTSWAWRFMLGSIYFGHWMPLTWLSWTVDAHLWGLWAGGWHGVNVLLHAANAVLVYLIAARLLRGELFESRRRVIAVFVALLWAVHPMRMESVAWITERKDVLSGFFVLLALWSYLCYVGGARRRWAFYALSLSCFILACLAKCIAVVLVPWLLLLDWSVLRRRALIEKAPYVLVAGLISEMAFYAVHVGVHNMLPWWTVGLGPRLLHVCYSLVFYVGNALWPSRLAHMIEYTWAPSWSQPQYPFAVGIVALVLGVLLLASRRWLTAAVLGYVVAVLPQAGLFQNGPQLVGNRYSYLALLPLMLLVGSGLTMASRWLPRALPLISTAAIIGGLVVVTSVNLPMWRDDTTLWTYAAEHEPTCTMCQDWAGVLAYARGDLPATRRYFERAIPVSLDTDFPRYERYWGLGKVLDEMHETEAAAATLRAYLNSVPAKYRGYAYEQHHIRDAEARLARLERSSP